MSNLRELVQDVKQTLDMRMFVTRMGHNLDDTNKMCCPFHLEKTPSCVVYPTHFKCFGGSCGKYGDFVDFYQGINPNASFIEALSVGAEFVNKDISKLGEFSDESVKELIEQSKQRRRLEDIYEAATSAYTSFLASDSHSDELLEFAKNKWGFDREFLKQERVGYAPRGYGHLKSYLKELKFSEGDMILSGLFYKNERGIGEVFTDRFIFPYIIGGIPKYFIGRVPRHYTEDEEMHNRKRPKYQKLLVHSNKNNHVSPVVQNRYLFNEDALHDRNNKHVIITEGVTDAMIGKQIDYPVVSPVTVRFRKQDLERYKELFKSKSCVYIANDNEENQSGIKGAIDIAEYLEENGCFVKIITIPKDEDAEKIDLNDYLNQAEDPRAAMATLKVKALTPLQFIINTIDAELDDMERTKQIVELKSWWKRVRIADLPTYEKILKEKFSLRADAAKALISEIKLIKKEKVAALEPKIDKSNWSIQEVVDDLFENPGAGRVASKVGDAIFNHLKNSGAKFYYHVADSSSVVYYKNRLFPYNSNKFRQLMFQMGQISKETSAGRAIFDHVNQRILQQGQAIDKFRWIHSNKAERKYYNLSGKEESEIICVDIKEGEPYTVPNGSNQDNILLTNPITPCSFNYIAEAEIERSVDLVEKLIFNNMTCSTANKYMILSWMLCAFFLDELETRPHLRLQGGAGAGKSTASKLITALLLGKPKLQSRSTMAAIYEVSRLDPIVCLDNVENANISTALSDYILVSATGAARHKKSGSNYDQIIEQDPTCLVMSTGIEPLTKHELIQRTFMVEFFKEAAAPGFNEGKTIHAISRNRDYILSGLLKLVRKIFWTSYNHTRFNAISQSLFTKFENNSKIRNIEALSYMYLINRELCNYIKHDYNYDVNITKLETEERMVRHIGNPMVHRDIFASWIELQNDEDMETNAGTSQIVYFLDLIMTKIEKGVSPDFLAIELGIDVEYVGDIPVILSTSNNLHQAFCKLSKEGSGYAYQTPMQLMKRIRDSVKILENTGWVWGSTVKRTSQYRVHAFARVTSETDMETLRTKWPRGNWDN